MQTSFQRWTTPTRAALIYTLEPVFAAVFSIWLMDEWLTPVGWAGGVLIVVGMCIAETWHLTPWANGKTKASAK